MEEKIREILHIRISGYQMVDDSDPIEIAGVDVAAKEIAGHFREFIEWIGSQDIWFNDTDGLWDYQLISYDGEMKHKTTDELYNYWLTNIKEKL